MTKKKERESPRVRLTLAGGGLFRLSAPDDGTNSLNAKEHHGNGDADGEQGQQGGKCASLASNSGNDSTDPTDNGSQTRGNSSKHTKILLPHKITSSHQAPQTMERMALIPRNTTEMAMPMANSGSSSLSCPAVTAVIVAPIQSRTVPRADVTAGRRPVATAGASTITNNPPSSIIYLRQKWENTRYVKSINVQEKITMRAPQI
nr:MAG TPA: hypothetical protein [Inoviridae sp.]